MCGRGAAATGAGQPPNRQRLYFGARSVSWKEYIHNGRHWIYGEGEQ